MDVLVFSAVASGYTVVVLLSTLCLAMTSGATFAGVVRALRGWETPLGRADRA